jgi:heme/copper-type cytochrome/quinol oxidase subunit 3
MAEAAALEPSPLPVGPTRRLGVGWWGAGTLIASEGALFLYLLFGYFYLGAIEPRGWVLEQKPDLHLAVPNTVLLLLSSAAAWYGEHGILHRTRGRALTGFAIALALGSVFVLVQWWEWHLKHYLPGTSSYASLYYTTTGFHIAHVLIGLAVLLGILLWTALDYFSPRRHMAVSAGVLYWHFVDVVWLSVFFTYYVTPYLGFGT